MFFPRHISFVKQTEPYHQKIPKNHKTKNAKNKQTYEYDNDKNK